MLQTKRKVAGIIAAVATIFSALVVSAPAQAANGTPPTPSYTTTYNAGTLHFDVGAGSGSIARTGLIFQYKATTSSTWLPDLASADVANANVPTTKDFTGLTDDLSYDVRVKSFQDNGTRYESGWVTRLVTVPSAPADAPVVTTTGSGLNVHLVWDQDTALSAGDYKKALIYVYKDGSAIASPGYVEASSIAANDDYTVTTGHTWQFAVKTKNSSGYSALSPRSDIITPAANTLPGIVESVVADTVHGVEFGTPQIRVAFEDPTILPSAAGKVKIEYKATTEAWTSAHSYITTYPVSGSVVFGSANFVPGTSYNVRISVSLLSASTVYGAVRELVVPVIPLTRPAPSTALTATPADSQVTLTWTKASNGGSPITNYYVDYRLASSGSWTSTHTTVDTNSVLETATITGLTNGTAYLFRVRAVNIEGDDQTGISTADAVTPNPLPGGPLNLIGSPNNSAVDLGWTAPLTADLHGQTISDYKVEYRASTSSTWNTFVHTASTNPSIRVTGLANSVGYYFRVSTKTNIGFSTATVSASTVTPTNSLGTPALDQVPSSLSAGAVSILDNQSSLGAIAVPTASSGVFRASAAGTLVTFKSLDSLGLALPLNTSNQLVIYAGNKVAVSATGLKAGSRARLYVSGTATSIGSAVADANGKVSFVAKLPVSLAKGTFVLQLNAVSTMNNLLSASIGANSAGTLLVTSKAVKFAFGSVKLTSTEKHKLRELVNGTSLTPVALRVIANTYGSATALDKKRATSRAKAVAAYLKTLGVTASFTTVNNSGKAKSSSSARNVVVTFNVSL